MITEYTIKISYNIDYVHSIEVPRSIPVNLRELSLIIRKIGFVILSSDVLIRYNILGGHLIRLCSYTR